MAPTQGPGRPAKVDYCLDCWREAGEPANRPPGARDKEINSYCRAHHSKRSTASQKKRQTLASARREVALGYWDEIPDTAREKLGPRMRDQIRLSLGQYNGERRATPWAFEWACVEYAITRGRRITLAEEDLVIEAFGGSRTGKAAYGPLGPPDWAKAGPVEVPYTGPVLLPQPDVRASFRASGRGGPTTDGEPTFTEYYQQERHAEPPEDLAEDRGRASSVSDEDELKFRADDDSMWKTQVLAAAWNERLAEEAAGKTTIHRLKEGDPLPPGATLFKTDEEANAFMESLQERTGQHPLGGEDE